MGHFDARRISDPVYGTITLSDLELRVINTPAFQRLRNVKQLGLAHYVYPGCDYSRFSHSVGVCHVEGRILSSLRDNGGVDISEKELQTYRLAALLHDVGHYPFSHAMQDALDDYHSRRVLKQSGVTAPLSHEEVGGEILTFDKDLKTLVDGPAISAIFRHTESPRFTNTVSSDLDADRIDFLLRTAHYTGLPYGDVDLDYIISQMRVDASDKICLTHKAVRAADHFLLCRFFDRQQVAYHKTVAGLELVLKDVLVELMVDGRTYFEPKEIRSLIKKGGWASFDDANIVNEMRRLYERPSTKKKHPALFKKLACILERRPPKLVCELEYMADRTPEQAERFALQHEHLSKELEDLPSKFKIEKSLIYVWRTPSTGRGLTKVPPVVATSTAAQGAVEEEAFDESVLILGRRKTKALPIFEQPDSLMKVLAQQAMFAIRVFVLVPGQPQLAQKIETHLRKEVKLPWK